MLKRSDVEAYLGVLGFPSAGTKSENICGCLCRLEEQLLPLTYGSREWRTIYDTLKYREKLNGYLPVENPSLRAATKHLAELLSALLEQPDALY